MDNELKDILDLINKVEVLNAKVMADETLTSSDITLFEILINRK